MNVVRNTSSQKQSIALYELMFYGLLVRSGQLASILLALQFSQIFTNPGQIVFLLPIAIILIAFLGMLTLIEIECTRYMCDLDNRIQAIKAYLNLNLHQFPKNYLEKIVLPVLLNILSLPALLLFLGWTSTYLFLILMLSIAISSAVIFKFNYQIFFWSQIYSLFIYTESPFIISHLVYITNTLQILVYIKLITL